MSSASDEIVDRPAARALLLTPQAEVLLMLVEPRRDFLVWITPGGGLDDGETALEGAIREVREETGRELTPTGGPIWTREHEFEFAGRKLRQQEVFYVFRTERFEPDTDGFEAVEREFFREYRWWGLEALRASDEHFAPTSFPELLRALVEQGPPSTPIDVGV